LQKRVWNEVRKIPLGGSSTYTKIAAAIGARKRSAPWRIRARAAGSRSPCLATACCTRLRAARTAGSTAGSPTRRSCSRGAGQGY
jgi:hypothetical protein